MPIPEKALTVGEIARRLKVPIHRVEYIIRARQVEPMVRAGICRVFTESDFDRIAHALLKGSHGEGGR